MALVAITKRALCIIPITAAHQTLGIAMLERSLCCSLCAAFASLVLKAF